MTHAIISFWAFDHDKTQFAWVSEFDEISWMSLPIINSQPYTQFGTFIQKKIYLEMFKAT